MSVTAYGDTPFLPQPGVPKVIASQSHGHTAVAFNPTTTAAAVSPSDPDNPYESIVTRNVFGLDAVPPPAPPAPPDGPPSPKITLTGITTILGPTQALFKVAGVVHGNGRPQDESYMLAEGEEQDDVRVKTIDIEKSIVTFMNHGVEQEIPLTENGASSSGPPQSPASWPGQNGIRGFPGFRGLGGQPGFQPQTFGGQPKSSGNGFNTQSVDAGLSGEDEAALIAAQHAQMQQQGNPMSQIMPPTPLDKEAGVAPEPGAEAPDVAPTSR